MRHCALLSSDSPTAFGSSTKRSWRPPASAERHEERLHRQANFDALTGLANRSLFFDRLNQALLHARRHGLTAALLFVDLNHFKSVNDSYGHVAGDQLLTQIAAALTATVRREDTVARLGGDEFAILLPQIDTHQHAALLAEKVLAVVSRPYPVDGGQATISAAIGVALSSDCAGDGASFVKCADMAMFRCKKNGKGGYELFHREMAAEAERVRSMQQRLREALARGEFVLHYQPKVSFSSGTMTGCEALLRWQPPEQGLVMPGEFIGNRRGVGSHRGHRRLGGARGVRTDRALAVRGAGHPGGGERLGEADQPGVRRTLCAPRSRTP